MDELLQRYGSFGRYQAYLYSLAFIPSFYVGAETLMWTWTGYTPSGRCVGTAKEWR